MRLRLISSLLCLLLAFPAAANEIGILDLVSARSALYFVEKGNWKDAKLHASKVDNDVFKDYVTWLYLKSNDTDPTLQELQAFINKHPDWPDIKTLTRKVEGLIFVNNLPNSDIQAWFSKHPPISGMAKIRMAQMSGMEQEKLGALVKSVWENDDLDAAQEIYILSDYAGLISGESMARRVDNQLWKGQNAAAKRLMGKVSEDYQKLFKARMALMADTKSANFEVSHVPTKLATHPGLIYDRMKWRARRNMDDGVKEMLAYMPANPPFADKWWNTREQLIREAIDDKKYEEAERLLSKHGQIQGESLAEALWLSGWIKLEFRNNPSSAYKDFYALFNSVKYPVSKSRGAYWAGRAAKKNGNEEIAKSWFKLAAGYQTTYYGQLAALELDPAARLALRASPKPTDADKERFEKNYRVRLVRILGELGEFDSAKKFVLQLMDEAKTPGETTLIGGLGKEIRRIDIGVKASKRATRNGIWLVENGFPRYTINFNTPIEVPLALAVTRQESEFDPNAVSPAGAMGLMQLLPGTAKETAKKYGITYAKEHLFVPRYNLELGSLYLGRMIDAYEGSYVAAIAAYNAGPGNVRKWFARFGSPGKELYQVINWVEMIPFDETRNYVQRVLENLQVYRFLENPQEASIIGLTKDLLR